MYNQCSGYTISILCRVCHTALERSLESVLDAEEALGLQSNCSFRGIVWEVECNGNTYER